MSISQKILNNLVCSNYEMNLDHPNYGILCSYQRGTKNLEVSTYVGMCQVR